MDIKVLIISLFFGFFSAQKKKDISISVFQETANDSICVSINNTSNDTVKILLDTHGLGKRLSLKSPKSIEPLSYIFAAMYYVINSKYNVEKGERYIDDLSYGFNGGQSLEKYIRDNTHFLLPKSSYHFKIDFSEVAFCKELKNRKKLTVHSFKMFYFGNEIINYLKKESLSKSQDLSKKYFNGNIISNSIKLRGNLCY